MLAVALASPLAKAQHVDDDASAATLAEAVGSAGKLVGAADEQLDKTETYRRCRTILEPWFDEALRNYRSVDDYYPWLLVICRFAASGQGTAAAEEAKVREFLAPWLEALQRQGKADRLAAIRWAWTYRNHLGHLGLKADAEAALLRAVKHRFAALQSTADNQLALDELTFVARSVYGSWPLQDEVIRLHAAFEAGLGPGHRLSLIILRAMAYHERFLGRPQAALAFIERAVTLAQVHHPQDTMLAAHMATEHAACLSSAGRLAEARQRMLSARVAFVAERPVSEVNLSRIDGNLAGMAFAMGDFSAAVAHADESIEHARLSALPVMLVEARVARATREVARLQMGALDAAANLREVLSETSSGEMHVGPQGFALVQHAAKGGDADLLEWAIAVADLHIRRYRAPLQPDAALRPLMQAWRAGSYALQPTAVRTLLDTALAISLTGRSPGTLALTQFSLARHLAGPDPDAALWLYKRGANALQQQRSGLPTGEPELHRAWLGVHESDLRAFIGLLIDRGRLIEAEQALMLLRDEESHEFSRRSLRVPARPRDGTGSAASQSLSFTPAESLRNAAMLAVSREAEVAAVAADVRLAARGRFAVLTDYADPVAQAAIYELAAFVNKVVDEAPAMARGVSQRRTDAVAALPPHTARLTYFVRDEGIDIVLQHGRVRSRSTVAVARSELNRAIQSARAALNSPQSDAMPALQTLHRWLLTPLSAQLTRAHVREVQWVPDAALCYVPFGALHDGRHYVAQRYVVTTRWAGSAKHEDADNALPSRPAPARSGGLLALGRTLGDASHGALPGVRQEIDTLRRAGALAWLDDGFTEQRLREGLARGPDVVHLASHFALDPAGEDKSYLLLGDGSRLSLSALAAMPWRGVNLAMLSACDTGVALESGPGQAMVGFASTLQRAGVAHVLATLWRVSDGATARWVEMFYHPAAQRAPLAHGKFALRAPTPNAARATQAQRQWIRQYAGSPLGHPHYWAAFTWLAGDS